MRYLRGGAGSNLFPLVDALAANQQINQPDRLTVLIGRENESAATLIASMLENRTAASISSRAVTQHSTLHSLVEPREHREHRHPQSGPALSNGAHERLSGDPARQAFGAMSVTVGKYVRYRPMSRVSRASSATAAWAPMKKSGSVDDLVPSFRR